MTAYLKPPLSGRWQQRNAKRRRTTAAKRLAEQIARLEQALRDQKGRPSDGGPSRRG